MKEKWERDKDDGKGEWDSNSTSRDVKGEYRNSISKGEQRNSISKIEDSDSVNVKMEDSVRMSRVESSPLAPTVHRLRLSYTNESIVRDIQHFATTHPDIEWSKDTALELEARALVFSY